MLTLSVSLSAANSFVVLRCRGGSDLLRDKRQGVFVTDAGALGSLAR
jgi:hypothetical protein